MIDKLEGARTRRIPVLVERGLPCMRAYARAKRDIITSCEVGPHRREPAGRQRRRTTGQSVRDWMPPDLAQRIFDFLQGTAAGTRQLCP